MKQHKQQLQIIAATIGVAFGLLPIAALGATSTPFTKAALIETWTQTGSLTDKTNPKSIFQIFDGEKKSVTHLSLPAGRKCEPPPPSDDEDPIEPPPCQDPATGSDTKPADALRILPLKDDEAAGLFIRIQAFQRYAAAQVEFSRYRTESVSPEELKTLEKQERMTLSDLLLLNTRLYYATATASDRCNRINRVALLYKQYQQRFGADPFEIKAQNASLTYTQDGVLKDLIPEFTNPRVCAFQLQGNRRQQEDDVQKKAAELFDSKVVKELETYEDGADRAGKTFGQLKSGIAPKAFPVKTQDILDFERNMINLQSNLDLVADDSFKIVPILNASKTSDGPKPVAYDKAGCGYLATVADYFQQVFNTKPYKLEEYVSACVPKTVQPQPPPPSATTQPKGGSPAVLKLAKTYITDASNQAIAEVEGLLKFVNDQVINRPGACTDAAKCFVKCKQIMPDVQSSPGKPSVLATKLSPRGPKDSKSAESAAYFETFKKDFDSCMEELSIHVESKRDFSADQKFQIEFSKEMKRLNSRLKGE